MGRQARNGSIMLKKDGTLIAFNLGADYVAEHEWGIKGLKSALGIPEIDKKSSDNAGIGCRTTTKVSDSLFIVEKAGPVNGYTAVVFERYSGLKDKLNEAKTFKAACDLLRVYGDVTPDAPRYGKPQDFLASWCDNDFAIIAKDATVREHLRTLYNALMSCKAAIWLGGGHVFENAGLVIACVDNIPQENLKEMKDNDLDIAALHVAASKTGIYEILEKAGKRFYALSPRWADEKKKSVKFWLNPMEQQKYNYGWYTVTQLKQWANDEGPIMVTKTEKAQ